MNRNCCRQPQICQRKLSRSSSRPHFNNRMTSLERLNSPMAPPTRINSAKEDI
jgi:hypothetical protein